MPMKLVGQWNRAKTVLGKMSAKTPASIDMAVRDEAFYFQRLVIESFRKQGHGTRWSPLSTITLAIRKNASKIGKRGSRSKTPLVKTGSLRRSVKVKRLRAAGYFVGVHRTAPRPKSLTATTSTMANIAAIHETGMVLIPITDKMRRFFRYLFWKGVIPFPWPSPNKRYILIKRRSFLADTMTEYAKGHEQRLMKRISRYINGQGEVTVK